MPCHRRASSRLQVVGSESSQVSFSWTLAHASRWLKATVQISIDKTHPQAGGLVVCLSSVLLCLSVFRFSGASVWIDNQSVVFPKNSADIYQLHCPQLSLSAGFGGVPILELLQCGKNYQASHYYLAAVARSRVESTSVSAPDSESESKCLPINYVTLLVLLISTRFCTNFCTLFRTCTVLDISVYCNALNLVHFYAF